PQGEDPFRPSAIIGRSPSVASHLGEAAGRRPSPIEHELGRDRSDGTIPEPIVESARTTANDLITPAPPGRPVPPSPVIPPPNTVKQPAFGVRENQFLGDPLPGLDLRPGGHGAIPKTGSIFGGRLRQPRQSDTIFNPTAPFLAEQIPSSTEPSVRDQIASLNSAVAALVVQLGSKGNKTDSGNPAPSQQATPKIPGMSMKLPIDVPLFSGTGSFFRNDVPLFSGTEFPPRDIVYYIVPDTCFSVFGLDDLILLGIDVDITRRSIRLINCSSSAEDLK
ncbi:MAG: hypothetical protein GY696_05200, partial [Gammaproteobacteria bacterium]|nr:hypothetical protein [Gammaproteobacteria bacterium]